MRWFREQNWRVDYASPGEETVFDCDFHYSISIKRNPFSIKNVKAYRELKTILSSNSYNIIHCHTPMGSVLGRLAAKNIKEKTTLIYTAHGFHFYRGAPLINKLVYYPIEKYLAKYTDALITINDEDYKMAKLNFLSCQNIYKLNGIGVDLDRFMPCDNERRKILRKNFGIGEMDFVILYVAEFIPRKNHKLFIRCIKTLNDRIKNLKVFFVGTGPLFHKHKKNIEAIGLSGIVQFLGYRYDVEKLCNIADIGISASKQEGLPIGIVEYIVSGLPVVCSKIRGHVDVIINRQNGLLFNLNEPDQVIDSIVELYADENLRKMIIQSNLCVREKYSLNTAITKMAEIYKRCM